MHKFTDKTGREWSIEFTYGVLEQVKNDLDINLLDIQKGGQQSQSLSFDLKGFVNLLFVLCEEEATAAGINDVQFGRAMNSQSLSAAFESFKAEYIDFFQFSPETQKILRAAMGKAAEATQTMVDMAVEEINSPETATAIMEKLTRDRASMRGSIATALKGSPA